MSQQLTRAELHELVWKRPVTKVAADLGISDVALHKICRKHKVPVPSRGHWAKLAAGKSVSTTKLPKQSNSGPDRIEIHASAVRRLPTAVLAARERALSLEAQAIARKAEEAASEPIQSPHIERLRKKLENAKPRRDGFVKISGKQQFSITVTPSCTDRAVQTLDRIVTAALSRKYQLKPTEAGLALKIDGEHISFSISETIKQVPHEPTTAELARVEKWEKAYNRKIRLGQWASTWGKPEIPEFDQVPSGQLTVEMDQGSHYDGLRRRFSDGKRQRIENLGEKIVTAAATCAAAAVERRKEAIRRQREREEWEKRHKEIERQHTLEKKRWEFLEKKMKRLERAQQLESFVSDYETNFSPDALPISCQSLLHWASAQAASIRSEISPPNLAAALDHYDLMNDNTSIDSWVRFDD